MTGYRRNAYTELQLTPATARVIFNSMQRHVHSAYSQLVVLGGLEFHEWTARPPHLA